MRTAKRTTSALKQSASRQRQRLGRLRRLSDDMSAMQERIEALEAEVQENRHLNRRIAELTDVVQEILLPPDRRDEDKLRRHLSDYDAGQ